MKRGIFAGYPVVDLKVTLYDGSYHDVDSSDMAFQIAASMGLQKGFMEAHPILLEPVMNVEVTAPSDHAGDVIGDINGRRGRVVGMEPDGETVSVRAQVPMAEMLTYESSLRSMTGGRGAYSMEFSHYEEVPAHLAEKVVKEAKAEKEKDALAVGARMPPSGPRDRGTMGAMSFVSHIECTVCGKRHEAGRLLTVCEACGQMLAVRYDLARVAAAVTKDALRLRPPGMYRFRELVPLADGEEPVSLGEGGTPLLELPRLAAHVGVGRLWGKDEGQNPTGSFKARGLGMAVTKARTLGVTGLMIPSAGNAGGAAAVYGARAGVPVAVVVPARHARGGRGRGHSSRGPSSSPWTAPSRRRASSSAASRPSWAGSTWPRSRSRTGSRARRPWGSSWPSSSTGTRPTCSCTRPAAARGWSASGRPTRSSPRWAG